ncbi:hypothetical protein OROMI_028184 [Orobanche minor]
MNFSTTVLLILFTSLVLNSGADVKVMGAFLGIYCPFDEQACIDDCMSKPEMDSGYCGGVLKLDCICVS